MNRCFAQPLIFAALLSAQGSLAQTREIAVESLASDTVHGVAERSILATDASGRPLTALLRLRSGDELPPHGAGGGWRIITVLRGKVSWGDGSTADPAQERAYGAGSVLVLAPGEGMHWAAARSGDVLLQVVLIHTGDVSDDLKATLASLTGP